MDICKQIIKNGIRHYETSDGRAYPSITSILSRTKDNSGLDEWRKKMGESVAEYIMNQAKNTGSATHKIIEQHLKESEIDYSKSPLLARAHFENLKPLLGKISNVRGLEIPLFSHNLEVAGTADCVANYDGRLSIIDFKTSRSDKKEDWIKDYFLQATAYSVMWKEQMGESVDQIVILISSEKTQREAFIKKPVDYIDELTDRINQYHSKRSLEEITSRPRP